MKKILLFSLIFAINLPVSATVHKIRVSNFQFSPKRVNAVMGDTILWVYKIGFHTTTSTTIPAGAAPWDSPMDVNTTRFSYVVNVPGVYNYTCLPHAAEMQGVIRVFENKPATISSFTITKNENNKPELLWNMANAPSVKYVSVQRSYDGETFEEIKKIVIDENTSVRNTEKYIDNTALTGSYIYYLLEIMGEDNKIMQTAIKTFSVKIPSKLIISLSPNPLTSPHLSIKFNSFKEGYMKVALQNEKGSILMQENMWAEPGINNAHLHIGDLLKPGTYYLVCNMGQ